MGFAEDIAAQIAGSRASNGGNFIRDGRGVLVIKKISIEKLYEGQTFIAELCVVESAPSGEKDEKGQEIQPNPVGSTVSFIQQLEKRPQTAFGNTKAFLLAAAEEDEDNITSEEFKAFLDDAKGSKQALRGKLVSYETRRKWTKDKSKLLTLPVFRAYPQTAEDIAARRAAIEASPGMAVTA